MGDTGCHAKDCAAGRPAEPFASLAANAASDSPPDVLLHVGDYNYRGTASKVSFKDPQTGQITTDWAYDAGDGTQENENCGQAPDSGFVSQNSPQSTQPDAWEFWRDDFFTPAGEMLWSAPWIFARGNHELCSRAGPGWFYFLDASSNLPAGGGLQRSCPTPDPKANPFENVVLVEPYLVDLGSLQMLVVDSANACDAFATPQMTAFSSAYAEQFAQVGNLTPSAGVTWLMTHRPIWGVEAFEPGTSTGCSSENHYGCINRTMQYAIRQSLEGNLPAGIQLLLAGHMHRFQSLTFSSQRPPQLIVGDSGVRLDGRPPTGSFTAQVGDTETQGRATGASITTPNGPVNAFAFMEIRFSTEGWEGILTNLDKTIQIASCGSEKQSQGSVCEFESGLEVK
ncbi:MAG: metallophosphoesterase [Acidobacteriota bacterium]